MVRKCGISADAGAPTSRLATVGPLYSTWPAMYPVREGRREPISAAGTGQALYGVMAFLRFATCSRISSALR